MTRRSHIRRSLLGVFVATLTIVAAAHAGDNCAVITTLTIEGPAAEQFKRQMRQQIEAEQKDVARYQQELADKNAEIVRQFDENGDGKLLRAEKSKYDKYMYEVRIGRKPNPFAEIRPPNQPATTPAKAAKK